MFSVNLKKYKLWETNMKKDEKKDYNDEYVKNNIPFLRGDAKLSVVFANDSFLKSP